MPTQELAQIPPWFVGALAAAVVALAGAIAYMFRLYNRRVTNHDKQMGAIALARSAEQLEWAKERSRWDAERTAWDAQREIEKERDRADYQERIVQHLQHLDDLLNAERQASREREGQQLAQFIKSVESTAAAATKAQQEVTTLLHKMHDRFLSGPRRAPRGG